MCSSHAHSGRDSSHATMRRATPVQPPATLLLPCALRPCALQVLCPSVRCTWCSPVLSTWPVLLSRNIQRAQRLGLQRCPEAINTATATSSTAPALHAPARCAVGLALRHGSPGAALSPQHGQCWPAGACRHAQRQGQQPHPEAINTITTTTSTAPALRSLARCAAGYALRHGSTGAALCTLHRPCCPAGACRNAQRQGTAATPP